MGDVDANGRSILHKGHGMTHTAAPPDVCKTPSPAGPVPIPYVNIAMDSNITDGADTVKIKGNPVANLGAKISTSTGDEPGSAGGGILSSKIKGTVTWKMGSLDVKAEGKSVVRFLDQDFHNGNSFNTVFISPGRTGMAYGDDFTEPCPICDKTADQHDPILETANSARICTNIIRGLIRAFNQAALNREQGRVAKPRFTGRKRKKFAGWKGYMVGVMVCKHPNGSTPRIFAAMSGYEGVPDFEAIALRDGPVDEVVPTDGAVTQDDIVAGNRSRGVSPQRVTAAVDAAWQEVEESLGERGSTPLGSCAAQRLIAKSGHAPAQMTEMFFSPPGEDIWAGQYRFRVNDQLRDFPQAPWFGPAVQETPATPWGTTVASCHNCQKLLPLMLCPKRRCA